MMNVKDYIQSNETLKNFDFMTVYVTILEVMKDRELGMRSDVSAV